MDAALLPAILGAFPQLSGAGLLVFLIVLLVRREGQELTRVREAHTAEIRRKNDELVELRLRIVGLNEQIDSERGLRRAAEDTGRHRAPDPDGDGSSPG